MVVVVVGGGGVGLGVILCTFVWLILKSTGHGNAA
jgi:hypothetical protein